MDPHSVPFDRASWLPTAISWVQSWTDTEVFHEAFAEIRETYSRLDLIYGQTEETSQRTSQVRSAYLVLRYLLKFYISVRQQRRHYPPIPRPWIELEHPMSPRPVGLVTGRSSSC